MNPKSRFRISFTLLDLWNKGRIQDSINVYLHLPSPTSPQIQAGKDFHEKWADTISSTKKLKLGRTELSFVNPLCEYGSKGELIRPYNDLWDVGGRFDVLDDNTLYEFKTGKTESLTYSNGYQIPFYFLLAELSGITIEKALLCHYNQYDDKTDIMVIWNDPYQVQRARNLVESTAPEIYEYFKKNEIIT